MLNIEVIKFEAQDVITASGVKKPAVANHEHHWKWGDGPAVGTAGGTKFQVKCAECNSTKEFDQPIPIGPTLKW